MNLQKVVTNTLDIRAYQGYGSGTPEINCPCLHCLLVDEPNESSLDPSNEPRRLVRGQCGRTLCMEVSLSCLGRRIISSILSHSYRNAEKH